MNKLQFFTNGKSFTYVDVEASTYKEEAKQRPDQDFHVSGDVITASSVDMAIERHRNSDGDRITD